MGYFVVDGWQGKQITWQWVIKATCADEACVTAERRNAGVKNFDKFTAHEASDLFDAEENLTEALPKTGGSRA